MKDEVLNFVPAGAKRVLDCTIGDAGHAEAILKKFSRIEIIGMDADPEAILRSKNFLHRFKERVKLCRERFDNAPEALKSVGWSGVDFILFDLGWSSPQFSERGRGFSFERLNENLDMRYDPTRGRTAAQILNEWDKEEIGRMLRINGEEKNWKKITQEIENIKKARGMRTVGDLVDASLTAYGAAKTAINPATKTFQAVRIAVNDELNVLRRALERASEALSDGGQIAVITFHSLEDRIVKEFFKEKSMQKGQFAVLTKKPILPKRKEILENPRSRSGKLRVLKKNI